VLALGDKTLMNGAGKQGDAMLINLIAKVQKPKRINKQGNCF